MITIKIVDDGENAEFSVELDGVAFNSDEDKNMYVATQLRSALAVVEDDMSDENKAEVLNNVSNTEFEKN